MVLVSGFFSSLGLKIPQGHNPKDHPLPPAKDHAEAFVNLVSCVEPSPAVMASAICDLKFSVKLEDPCEMVQMVQVSGFGVLELVV